LDSIGRGIEATFSEDIGELQFHQRWRRRDLRLHYWDSAQSNLLGLNEEGIVSGGEPWGLSGGELSEKSDDCIRFDEREDVLASLDLLKLITPLLDECPAYWKWAIIAAHNALQGAMVCALADSAGLTVLNKDSSKKHGHGCKSKMRNEAHRQKDGLQRSATSTAGAKRLNRRAFLCARAAQRQCIPVGEADASVRRGLTDLVRVRGAVD
jgi:hypothetical protein